MNNAKNIFLVLLLTSLFSLKGWAQEEPVVKWTFTAKKTGSQTYDLYLQARMAEDWHIYSQFTPEGGPIPTSFQFTVSPDFSQRGAIKELGEMEQYLEPLFGVEVKQFGEKVDFVQSIVLHSKTGTEVSGTIEFMACNSHQCLPPQKQKFTILIK
jgi:hypothetical protein